MRNDQGEYVDPVTFKTFTNSSHIVAIRKTGNVFSHDTVERLNFKAKMWKDLVTEEDFSRKDVITLQDPHNVEARNLSSFKHLQDGVSTLTPEQQRERSAGINKVALGNAASVLKSKDGEEPSSKPQVGKYLPQTQHKEAASNGTVVKANQTRSSRSPTPRISKNISNKPTALHTTGRAAASLTSTGLTPHTSNALAELSQEDYLLKPKRVKQKGYATIRTNHGDLTLELYPEYAPKAVWNFVKLSKQGYYNGIDFHRNIKNFMLQGGDPTGTGRGGSSTWGKPFADEWAPSPLSHDSRGVLSMANKGKDTNTSQFFITYRQCPHLNRKHTIFGRVVAGSDTSLSSIENVDVSEMDKRPLEPVTVEELSVFVDPFEEFLKEQGEREEDEKTKEQIRKAGGTEDERVTWTGKRTRNGDDDIQVPTVGKYLANPAGQREEVLEEWEEAIQEPTKKKARGVGGGAGFGNFDTW